MPLYAYRCSQCDNHFQTLVRSSETPECPACGSHALEQQLSLPAKPAPGGPGAAAAPAPACAGMSGGTPCGAACPAFGDA